MAALRRSPSGKLVELGAGGGAPLSFMYWIDVGTSVAPIDQTGAEGAPFSSLTEAIALAELNGINEFMLGRAVYSGVIALPLGGALMGTVIGDSLTPLTSIESGTVSSPNTITLVDLVVGSAIAGPSLFAYGVYFTGGAITLTPPSEEQISRATFVNCTFFSIIPTVITFGGDDPGVAQMDEYSYANFQNNGGSVVNGSIQVIGTKHVRAVSASSQSLSSVAFEADDMQVVLTGAVAGQQVDVQWFGNVNITNHTNLLATGRLVYSVDGDPEVAIVGSTLAWGNPTDDFFNGAMAGSFTVPGGTLATAEIAIYAEFSTDSTDAGLAIENRAIFAQACPKA